MNFVHGISHCWLLPLFRVSPTVFNLVSKRDFPGNSGLSLSEK